MTIPSIDMRSDVVTQPTDAMRDAMRDARLGAYLDTEDPTTAELEARTAQLFGKPAGLLVPSATMANLIACLHYCGPGEQALVDTDVHLYRNEFAGMARVGGILPRVVRRSNALPNVEDVTRAVSARAAAEYPIRLLWVENTHNVGGGAVSSPSEIGGLRNVVARHSIKIHMDGARVFNAATALGVPVSRVSEYVDSVSVGFNKALSCPAGCVLVGDEDLIAHAKELRRMLGGRLTKSGVIAAACLVALDTTANDLEKDHRAATALGNAIEATVGLKLESPVTTNIVRFDTSSLAPAGAFVKELEVRGLRVGAVGPNVIRAVTHRHIGAAEVELAITAIRDAAFSFKGEQVGAVVA